MKIKSIRINAWYHTKSGIGQVTAVGKQTVTVRIHKPFTEGVVSLAPDAILKEADEAVVTEITTPKEMPAKQD